MILSFANKLTSRLLNKAHKVWHGIYYLSLPPTPRFSLFLPLLTALRTLLQSLPTPPYLSCMLASPFAWNAFPNCLLNNYLSEFNPSSASSRNLPEPHSTPPKPLPCSAISLSLHFCCTLYWLLYFALLPSFGYFPLIEREVLVSGDLFLS